MKKIILFLALLTGCTSNPTYKEGTLFNFGCYLPYDGGLVGLEVIQYLNGCKISCSNNHTFEIERTYTATNDYLFGMVKTTERTDTKVKVKK